MTKIWGCFLLGLVITTLPSRALAKLETVEVTLDYVAKKAEQRAHKPFHSPKADLPEVLRADKLDYDKYREIEFRHDKALWAAEGLPFRVEFFHPGYLYQEPVHLNEFTLTHLQPIRFVQDFFNYRSLRIQKQIPADTGYAGFKLLYPLNGEDHWDELGAFLGASYFRLLGKGQRYGQSARGLALDCGESDRPEEFPIFTDWWLGKPHREDDQVRLYAILDSVSCVGAYAFLIKPGETTIVDIEAVLYFRDAANVRAVDVQRKPLKTMGLAPLTSMFWFGDASPRKFQDYRRGVHDSDGLLIRMDNGEVLWRPLNNPAEMRHQRFAAKNIKGFGLLQRERDFANYQDLFNLYQQVPSVWVEPHGHWGEGEVNLVELSTHYEGLDNIVTFWDPKEKPQPMQPYRFGYTLYWTRETDVKLSPNKVVATRVGADPRDPNSVQFVLDFAGPKLIQIPDNAQPQAIASCSDNAVIAESQVFRNTFNGTWRVMLKLSPKASNKDPVDLRCTLKKGEEVLTETWTYLWSPL
ncbi:MAG TPA: glucan biosynthesis protein G [Bacillota bacterium]|nr:glucan biosynthesis protein G [Bacillota bacterium]